MNITGWFTGLFSKIEGFFTSTKAHDVEKQLALLVQQALPIVEMIGSLVPNKTLQEVIAAYKEFGVSVTTSIANDPTSIGNALLNLGTSVLEKNHAPGEPTSILNTAIQLAVLAVKSK